MSITKTPPATRPPGRPLATATATATAATATTARVGTRLLHRNGLWSVAALALLAALLVAASVVVRARDDGGAAPPPACTGRQYVAGGVCWIGSTR